MRPVDVQNLIRFNTRMGMYISPLDRWGVQAFLHGYECGTAGECRFTEILSEHLAKRHRVKPGACGWREQIERLAQRRSLGWMDVYLLVSSEVLSAAVESVESSAQQAVATERRASRVNQNSRSLKPRAG